MKSNYKRLGDYIRESKEKNRDLRTTRLLGINVDKYFMPSVANVIGTDLSNYRIVKPLQFACNRMHVGRDYRIPISLSKEPDEFIVSPAYDVFEVIDATVLDPEYLMMWFSRKEFDRNAWFYTDADVRGGLSWDAFCNMELPIPHIDKQREIVKEYHTIVDRISLNETMNRKLEETAQAIYRHWFESFEFPISREYAESLGQPDLEGKPYKSSGGEMVFNEVLQREIPKGWGVPKLKDICSKIGSGSTPSGGKAGYHTTGISLVRSTNVFDYRFSYDDLAFINDAQAKKLSGVILEENDVLLNITGVSVARCCIVPKNVLPARVNQHVAIIRLKSGINASNYLLCALCSTNLKNNLLGISSSGSTREALTKTDIEEQDLLMPKSEVLEQFEQLVGSIISFSDNQIQSRESAKNLCELVLAKMTKVGA